MYQFGFLPRWVGWGVREVQQGGDICIPMADSCWCMAEAITILQSNYPPIKNKIKKNKIPQLFSCMVGLWMIYIYFFVLLSKSVYIMPYSLPNVYVCVWILRQPSFSWKKWWSHQYGKKLVAYKCFFVFVFFSLVENSDIKRKTWGMCLKEWSFPCPPWSKGVVGMA